MKEPADSTNERPNKAILAYCVYQHLKQNGVINSVNDFLVYVQNPERDENKKKQGKKQKWGKLAAPLMCHATFYKMLEDPDRYGRSFDMVKFRESFIKHPDESKVDDKSSFKNFLESFIEFGVDISRYTAILDDAKISSQAVSEAQRLLFKDSFEVSTEKKEPAKTNHERNKCLSVIGSIYGKSGIIDELLPRIDCSKLELSLKDFLEENDTDRLITIIRAINSIGREEGTDNEENADIRLWVSGPLYSGRSTHMIKLWKDITEDDELRNKYSVIYISAENVTNDGIYNYISQQCGLKGPLVNIQKKSAKKLLLLIDNYEEFKSKDSDCISGELKQILNSDVLLHGIDIVVGARFSVNQIRLQYGTTLSRSYQNVFVKPLSYDTVRGYLSKQERVIADEHNAHNARFLSFPMQVLKYSEEGVYSVGECQRELIIDRLKEVCGNNPTQKAIFGFCAKYLLPVLAYKNIDKSASDLEFDVNDIRRAIEDYKDLNHGSPKLDDLYALPGNGPLYQLSESYFPHLWFLSKKEDEESVDELFYWNDSHLKCYFAACGMLLRMKAGDQNGIIALTNELEQIIEKKDAKNDIEIYDAASYVFDLAETYIDIANPSHVSALTSFYVTFSAFLDIYGYEPQKYKAAKKALEYIEKYPNAIPNEADRYQKTGSTAYQIVKSRWPEITSDERNKARQTISEAVQDLKKLLEQTQDMHECFRIRLDIAKMYGNLGASEYSKKNYAEAEKHHSKSLQEKLELESAIKNGDITDVAYNDKRNLYEGIRRSYTCLGSDYFFFAKTADTKENKKEFFNQSLEQHEKAINVCSQNSQYSLASYENYTRKIGSYIGLIDLAMDNKDFDHIILYIRDSLNCVANALQQMGELSNLNEISDLCKFAGSMLDKIELMGDTGFKQELIEQDKVLEILKELLSKYQDTWFEENKELHETVLKVFGSEAL